MKKQREKDNRHYDRLIYIKIRVTVILTIILLCLGGGYWFFENYRINDVYVEGNEHYTAEQIEQIVMEGWESENSVFLSLKYKNKSITDVPFVERMDVSIVDKHTVKITVYEKALAGYVEYLGNFMYFDKDGIVVESSSILTPGIPEVTGLKYNYIVLHEPLPVEDNDVFAEVLNITQLMNKYGLSADRIYFSSSYEITLFFGGVRVQLGDESYLDEKIMRLPYILPSLEGKSGVLHLESFTPSTRDTTFDSD